MKNISDAKYVVEFQMVFKHIFNHSELGCPILCENIVYDKRYSKMGKNSLGNKDHPDKSVLYVVYNSPKVKIEEEYTLMGLTAIISATGGSLGLFLGFSCYGAIWSIFEVLETVFNSILKSGKRKRANTGNGWSK